MRESLKNRKAKMKVSILLLVLVCGLVAFAAENDLSGKLARLAMFETWISPWYTKSFLTCINGFRLMKVS